MKLILTNHYPYPYPENISEEGGERLSAEATDRTLELSGVVHFEQKHATTIEFADVASYADAKAKTGWKPWGSGGLTTCILEAPVSKDDGYGPYPAIIAENEAWCGVILKSDVKTVTTTTTD
jgi:hypothetical protein